MNVHATTLAVALIANRCPVDLCSRVSLALDEHLRLLPSIPAPNAGFKAAAARHYLAAEFVAGAWDTGVHPDYDTVVDMLGDRADYPMACTLQAAWGALGEADRVALRGAAVAVQVAAVQPAVEREAEYIVRLFDSHAECERELAGG